MNPFLISITKRFKEGHGCHTVILYGSRARGDFNDSSDWDVIGFREVGQSLVKRQ